GMAAMRASSSWRCFAVSFFTRTSMNCRVLSFKSKSWHLAVGIWPSSYAQVTSLCCQGFQPLQRVGILADQQHERGCLRIRLAPPLLPLFQRSFVDVQFAREHCPGAPQPFTRLPDQLGVNFGKGLRCNLVAA